MARQIAPGETVEKVARPAGLSSVTIRNQLRSVLGKPALVPKRSCSRMQRRMKRASGSHAN